ncbi:MAG: hypothetical protein ABIB79_02825 [archaeon]
MNKIRKERKSFIRKIGRVGAMCALGGLIIGSSLPSLIDALSEKEVMYTTKKRGLVITLEGGVFTKPYIRDKEKSDTNRTSEDYIDRYCKDNEKCEEKVHKAIQEAKKEYRIKKRSGWFD